MGRYFPVTGVAPERSTTDFPVGMCGGTCSIARFRLPIRREIILTNRHLASARMDYPSELIWAYSIPKRASRQQGCIGDTYPSAQRKGRRILGALFSLFVGVCFWGTTDRGIFQFGTNRCSRCAEVKKLAIWAQIIIIWDVRKSYLGNVGGEIVL